MSDKLFWVIILFGVWLYWAILFGMLAYIATKYISKVNVITNWSDTKLGKYWKKRYEDEINGNIH